MSFTTILMDPPWPENGGGKIKRGANRHYKTLKVRDIFPTIRLSSAWQPALDSHLYCWVTNTYLIEGLQLMAALDYRYVTNLAWVKDKSGLGRYFRGRHELCLFGVRGAAIELCTDRRDIGTVFDPTTSKLSAAKARELQSELGLTCLGARRGRKHSEKPSEFYDLIESRSPGPYLEMFARSNRPGWTGWGDEFIAEEATAA